MGKNTNVNIANQPTPQGPTNNKCSCGNVAKVGTNAGPKCFWCWIGNADRYYKLSSGTYPKKINCFAGGNHTSSYALYK